VTGPGAEVAERAEHRGFTVVARGLFLRRGTRELLSGADLAAAPGTTTAVTGPSGSGKTSLLLLLAKLDEPDAGTVELVPAPRGGGGTASPVLPAAARRPAIGYVPQTLALVPHLTAAENVAVPLQARRLPPAEVRDRSLARLGDVGLEVVADRVVGELSGGQRQRVAVARALALRPDVLVADEPTTELDAANRDLVLSLVERSAAEGAAVVVATHDPDVLAACARGYRLEGGLLEEL